jgi:hypothetical protein
MANIPGINGFIQPGTFARDRVISRSVSLPGGARILCIMGEGLKEQTLVAQAQGGGADGSADCSPTGTGDGRYFSIPGAPLISGRTEVYINNNLLYGTEDVVDETAFPGKFDFRLDPETGCLELQKAAIGDQNGSKFSASSLNVGTGFIPDGICGIYDLISVIDPSAPRERWTVKAVSVVRDSNGNPVPGKTTFTVSGSLSGQVRSSNGSPILFRDSYITGTQGAVSGTEDTCADGFIVATSDDFGLGSAVIKSGDETPETTDAFEFSGNLIVQGQVVPGDELCIDGYVGVEIEDITYNVSLNKTTLTLKTDSLDSTLSNVPWEIRATNVFIDNPIVTHDGITGLPITAGSFTSSDIGKILMICGGNSAGIYKITKVTSSRRVRLEGYLDTEGLPTLSGDISGIGETGLQFHVLQTNGVLLFGIKPGSIPFEVGDRFFIDVTSRVLAANDTLSVRFISEADLNDPELFASAQELYQKHGNPSLTNTLSLGAEMAFENGAPAILALQCKPSVPRRTAAILLEDGFSACGGDAIDCQADDLTFVIPRPIEGLLKGRPDGDTQVNIFVLRNNQEIQIFPNKIAFYNSQLESAVGQTNFISSSLNSFSYTVINTGTKIDGTGSDGTITLSSETFATLAYDFNSDDVGKVIVLQNVEDDSGNVYTTVEDISLLLFGNTTSGAELVIQSVISDTTVEVVANDGSSTALIADGFNAQFFVKDISDTTNVASAVLFHRDLVSSGVLQEGDGIKITYIDEADADFFDLNWFDAFEALEASDCQIVVPLPRQTKSSIFKSAMLHVNTMSSINIQKERVALIGAIKGITPAALLGQTEIAVEDIGILEGIQGDSPEEIASGNTEDLGNYRLSANFADPRVVYFYPDEIVRSVNGTNTILDGFYLAAAAGGWFAGTQNVALPLTNKVLVGFDIPRTKKYRPQTLNSLGGEGATVLQPVVGGGRVLAGRTTSQSGFIEDEEISIIFIRDRVKETLRNSLRSYVGTVENQNTQGLISARVASVMSALVSQGLVTDFRNIRVERDKVDPRQWNVFLRFQPAYPINYIFIDIEVGVL